MSHKSHTSFSTASKLAVTAAWRDNLTAGFSATAYALREGREKPFNPHRYTPEVPSTREEMEAYDAWRQGAQMAERYWQDWATLPAAQAAEFERGAEAHFQNVVKPAQEAARKEQQKTATAATGGERVKGYVPIDEEKAARVNACKQAEEKVLRIIDALLTEYQNEAGDVAADHAAFQEKGFQRMSPAEQQAKHDEYKQRINSVQNALRWLALGRTHIEQGFMAVNRSIFRPTRISLPEDDVEG